MGNVSSQVTFKNSKGQVLILKVSEGKIKIFHQLCSRPPLAVPTAHFCISSSQLQCPEGGLRTFPLFAFPVAATEREIPNAESHTLPAMRGTGHSPAQTRLLCVGRMFITAAPLQASETNLFLVGPGKWLRRSWRGAAFGCPQASVHSDSASAEVTPDPY